MIPIEQTIIDFNNGNCFQACLASILEVSLEEIPNFMNDGPDKFANEVKSWSKNMGIVCVDYIIDNNADLIDFYCNSLFKDVCLIATGKSPRGKNEEDRPCVIYKNGKMIHDPHPTDKRGIDAVDFLMIIALRNPAEVIFNKKKQHFSGPLTCNNKEGDTYYESPVSEWFELTYAQYLTVPRLVMESMPLEWQEKMRVLLDEMDETFDWRPKEGCYWIGIRDEAGRFCAAPLADYRHGSCEHLRIKE